ncbi:MAG TPA: SIMPL domain-containing protein [Aestuariivirgaceae bacterium]|jgi:hypothetical protein
MPARCLLFLLSLFSLLTLTEPLLAEERAPPMRTLALVGSGEVRAKPDIALINVGVTIRAPTAREALMQNTTAMNDIVDYLKQADVDAKDIQTSSFTVNPAYVYDNQGKEPPKIVGYDVSNVLTLTVRKLSALGEILDRAVSKGSNQIFGIAFALADLQPLQDEARRRAVVDATRKAKLYAESTGVSLGPIISIYEQAQAPPVPMSMKRMEVQDAAVPIAEGEQVITSQISISWEIR